MRMRTASSPRPVQRKRVDHRPGTRIQMEVVERPQHRLAVSPHRRRVGLLALLRLRINGRPSPVRTKWLSRHQHPPRKVASLDPSRPLPRNLDRPQEPEPPQQIHPVRPNRCFRPPRGLQVTEESGRCIHDGAGRVDQPERHPRIVGLHQRADHRHRQDCHVAPLLPIDRHGPRR